MDEWLHCNLRLCDLEVKETGGIEDDTEHLQVDFANEYIGGGVLTSGQVQVSYKYFILNDLILIMVKFNEQSIRSLTILR